MLQIMISYRRADSRAAERISDRLADRFGRKSVLDRRDIPIGADPRMYLKQTASRTHVLLVIIAPRWLDDYNIANNGDSVDIEIETALQNNISVIPVLLDGVKMPDWNELPPSLSQLANINAASIRSGPEFDHDIHRLALLLENIVGWPTHFAEGRDKPRASRSAKKSTARTRLPSRKAGLDHILADEVWENVKPLPPYARPSEQSIRPTAKDAVEFAVSHPSVIRHGIPFLLEAWAFRPTHRADAVKRSRELIGGDAPFRSGASTFVARGTELKIELEVEPWTVEPQFQTVVWTGNIANASFRVLPGTDAPNRKVHGMCRISVGGLRISHVPFELLLGAESESQPQFILGKTIRNAFASYASKDRRRVLARVQGMQKFANIFMDVRNLESGAHYPARLLDEIKSSDVLYLFWSRRARQSEWVDREWRYGLQERGIDFIDPVPLVDPRKVPPPRELADTKHFNDWTLAWMEYDRSLSLWHRFRAWCAGE